MCRDDGLAVNATSLGVYKKADTIMAQKERRNRHEKSRLVWLKVECKSTLITDTTEMAVPLNQLKLNSGHQTACLSKYFQLNQVLVVVYKCESCSA